MVAKCHWEGQQVKPVGRMAVRGAKALEVWARRVTEGYFVIIKTISTKRPLSQSQSLSHPLMMTFAITKIPTRYPGVRVTNMSTAWKDGLAFCAIVHRFDVNSVFFAIFSCCNKRHDIIGGKQLKILIFLLSYIIFSFHASYFQVSSWSHLVSQPWPNWYWEVSWYWYWYWYWHNWYWEVSFPSYSMISLSTKISHQSSELLPRATHVPNWKLIWYQYCMVAI